ncbi:MAG: hypothetical protein K2X37_00195 [Chitinophagaceae bacterium]|nr:hypothetical protein [Chitinophagaceae bacterium]
MDQAAILSYVRNHPGNKVKLAYADIDGILRGKYITTDKFFSALENKTSFCNVIYNVFALSLGYNVLYGISCIIYV